MSVGMIVPPIPILRLFLLAGLRPIVIMHMFILQKLVIRMIFVVIPLVIVLMRTVVISLLVMIVVMILRVRREWKQHRGAADNYA